jgi:hypothetical protein
MNKLKFEALPMALHGVNIRSERGQNEWDIIRKKTYKKYNHTCCICGKQHMKCNAHEVWKLSINSRTSTGKQILMNVINVCEECHDVIHIMRLGTLNPNAVPEALNYYARINGISLQEAIEDYKYMGDKYQKTSSIKKWSIDLSLLDNDAYLKVFDIT